MPKSFIGLGFSLLYPDTWKVDNDTESSSVSLESPEGAFIAITKLDPLADPVAAVQQAGQTMSAEYDDIEQEDVAKRETVDISAMPASFAAMLQPQCRSSTRTTDESQLPARLAPSSQRATWPSVALGTDFLRWPNSESRAGP